MGIIIGANGIARIVAPPKCIGNNSSKTGLLTVQDLDFTLSSKSILTKIGEKIVHNKIRKTIADKARIPVKDKIDQQKSKLEKALNKRLNDAATLRSTVDRLRLESVDILPDAFQVVVVAEGKMRLLVGI